MRWALIKPLNRSLFYDPEVQEPLGLEYLAATLQACGCQVLILDSALNQLTDVKLARRAAAFQPDIVGFSITTDRELESVVSIYEECKAASENKRLCWIAGGNYVTTETGAAQKNLPQEIRLIKYDGETFVRQVYELWKEGRLPSLPRLSNGEPPLHPDGLPFPLRPYHACLIRNGWAFNMQGSRGCCGACRYCGSRGMRSPGQVAWRGRSPAHIVREIAHLYHVYAARTFNFVDEDFLGPPAQAMQRAATFAGEILRCRLKIAFGIQVRPHSLSEEIIDVMASAGLKYVFMGIESDNPADFKAWGRSYCDQTWQWVTYLQQKEIEINAGTLLFHPDSSFEGVRSFAGQLRRHRLLNYRTAVNRLDAMPGSALYEQYITTHPAEYEAGILSLPFKHPRMELFYETLLKTLAPIEIPSMHVLCRMPTIRTRMLFDPDKAGEYRFLKSVDSACDDRVADSFYPLLEMFEKENPQEDKIREMRETNRTFAAEMLRKLSENGLL
jgi:methylmalonyl-CoA mutase cobalamin-binding subunit